MEAAVSRWLALFRELTNRTASADNSSRRLEAFLCAKNGVTATLTDGDTLRRTSGSGVNDEWPPPLDILTLELITGGEISRSVSLTIPLKNARSPSVERNAATLARWILREEPDEVHVRRLMLEVRSSGLRSAERITAAAEVLVKANWLRAPVIGFGTQSKVAYLVNPKLWGR
jgi:hypothetical protein